MKIKELLTSEDKWCQVYFALDQQNNPVGPFNEDACRFCLLGALHKCYDESKNGDGMYGERFYKTRNLLREKILDKYNISGIMGFNDHYAKFEDVRSLVEELDV